MTVVANQAFRFKVGDKIYIYFRLIKKNKTCEKEKQKITMDHRIIIFLESLRNSLSAFMKLLILTKVSRRHDKHYLHKEVTLTK